MVRTSGAPTALPQRPRCASTPPRSPRLKKIAKLRSPWLARGGSGAPPERSDSSPERFRVDFRSVVRVFFVRFRCARARATQNARHAIRPVKMHTDCLSDFPRAAGKSRKFVQESLRKRVRARTWPKTTSERCPPRLRSVPGRAGSAPERPETPQERPGSVGGVPERPGSVPEVPRIAPRSPRGAPERFLVVLGSIWGRF